MENIWKPKKEDFFSLIKDKQKFYDTENQKEPFDMVVIPPRSLVAVMPERSFPRTLGRFSEGIFPTRLDTPPVVLDSIASFDTESSYLDWMPSGIGVKPGNSRNAGYSSTPTHSKPPFELKPNPLEYILSLKRSMKAQYYSARMCGRFTDYRNVFGNMVARQAATRAAYTHPHFDPVQFSMEFVPFKVYQASNTGKSINMFDYLNLLGIENAYMAEYQKEYLGLLGSFAINDGLGKLHAFHSNKNRRKR